MTIGLDDLDLFPAPTTGLGQPRRCIHPRYARVALEGGGSRCDRCGRVITADAAKRGRTSRNRGNSIERDIARALGLKRVGQFGGPDDVSGEMFVAQVKSGGAFPERLWGWLKALPRNASQTPLLVVTDAPGPGHRRRALVILELSDWAALHAGEVEP